MRLLTFQLRHFTKLFTGLSKKMLDVIFVLGSSGLRGRDALETAKKAVANFVNTPKITDVIYGVIYYGKTPELILPLKEQSRGQKLARIMESITWKEEGESLLGALEKANEMFTNEGRPLSRKVLIFFANEDPGDALDNSSKLLQKSDVKVIPVAVDEDGVHDSLRKTNPKGIIIAVDDGGKPDKDKPTIEEEALKGKFSLM